MMVAVEKWGCNEIRVSLFLHSASFSHISNRSTQSQFLVSAFLNVVLGGSARQMRAMGQITKVSVFLQGFTLNAGGTRYRQLAFASSYPKFCQTPNFYKNTVSAFKNRNVILREEMIIHQSKLDGNEKLSQKYIYFWKLVRWRLNKLFRFSLSKNDIFDKRYLNN